MRREPIDRAAAMMFAAGVKTPAVRMGTMNHWEACPPLADLKRRNVHENLTGKRQGRMAVIGLARDIEARWIVRCDCGDYEPRKAKAIKNPANSNDCCAKCRQMVESKRAHEFRATGRNRAERYPTNATVEARRP